MTPHTPAVTAHAAARVAIDLGFRLERQKGSHAIYYRERDGARLVLPMHAGVTLKPKTLAGIVSDMGLTMNEFRAHL